jgi:hypothetical protein
MVSVLYSPSVLHGGGDDLNHALASLSWKEMAIMTGIALGIFILVLLIALIAE